MAKTMDRNKERDNDMDRDKESWKYIDRDKNIDND